MLPYNTCLKERYGSFTPHHLFNLTILLLHIEYHNIEFANSSILLNTKN